MRDLIKYVAVAGIAGFIGYSYGLTQIPEPVTMGYPRLGVSGVTTSLFQPAQYASIGYVGGVIVVDFIS